MSAGGSATQQLFSAVRRTVSLDSLAQHRSAAGRVGPFTAVRSCHQTHGACSGHFDRVRSRRPLPLAYLAACPEPEIDSKSSMFAASLRWAVHVTYCSRFSSTSTSVHAGPGHTDAKNFLSEKQTLNESKREDELGTMELTETKLFNWQPPSLGPCSDMVRTSFELRHLAAWCLAQGAQPIDESLMSAFIA